jgi:hypothetical protein
MLVGPGYSLEADNFATVDAVSNAHGDQAGLGGAFNGTNTYTARYAATTLTGLGYSLEVDYFSIVIARNPSAAIGVANLYPLSGYANGFYGDPTASYMFSFANTDRVNPVSTITDDTALPYYRSALGFNAVTALGAGSDVSAALYNYNYWDHGTSVGPCNFVGLSNSSFLCGKGWAIQVNSAIVTVQCSGNSATALMVSVPGDSTGAITNVSGFATINNSKYTDFSSAVQALSAIFGGLWQKYGFPGSFSLNLGGQIVTW